MIKLSLTLKKKIEPNVRCSVQNVGNNTKSFHFMQVNQN